MGQIQNMDLDNDDEQLPGSGTIFEDHVEVDNQEDNAGSGKKTQARKKRNRITKISIIAGAFLIFLLLFFLCIYAFKWQIQMINILSSQQSIHKASDYQFPKVLWIYTENQPEAEEMYQQVFISHLNYTVSQMGYEVRFVNSWTAYDWISQAYTDRITKAMHNSKIDQGVHNLLRMALLVENGGLMVSGDLDTVITGKDLKWLEELFSRNNNDQGYNYDCSPSQSSIFLFKQEKNVFKPRYIDNFIASVPYNPLLLEGFDLLESMILTGVNNQAEDLGYFIQNQDTNITYLQSGFRDSLNLIIEMYQAQIQKQERNYCKRFGLQGLKKSNYLFFSQLKEDDQLLLFSSQTTKEIKKKSGLQKVQVLLKMGSIPKKYLQSLTSSINTHSPKPLIKDSLVAMILEAPGNREVFISELPERQIELCLIIMEDLDDEQILITSQSFEEQTYQKWKLIIPAKNIKKGEMSKTIKRVTLMPGRNNQIKNIEKAAIKQCDTKGYAVLLNYGETFTHKDTLTEIANKVKRRDVVGAFIRLNYQGNVTEVTPNLMSFHRGKQGIVDPQIQTMSGILNHFRIFSIQSFRYIPQMDLRDFYGNYFSDRTIFLITLLQLIRTSIDTPEMLYIAKKYSHLWNIPNSIELVASDFTLNVSKLQHIDLEQLKLTKTKLQCEEIYESLKNILKWKIPFQKLLAFNKAEEFVSVESKKGEDLIPAIIHQAWFGSKRLPPAKEYFFKKTKLLYPKYEVKLWRQQNLTKENFPITYDILQNLLNFNKNSPYNKLATVTNVMSHELLYRQGGFWKNAGMNLLRPIFDKFRKYKLFLPVDKTFRYRWLQGMSVFGHMPKYQRMQKITNVRNLNRMQIYKSYAIGIAGSIDFRQLLHGQQQYSSDIILIPYETFYPAQVIEHPEQDLCTKHSKDSASQQYEIIQNDWILLENCQDLYPYSFGIEHNRFGDTWSKRKHTTM